MSCSQVKRICVILVVLAANSSAFGLGNRDRKIKANVRFIASSSFFRTNWGLNSDTYLAELTPLKQGEPALVRIVDEYPNRFAPLTRAVLQAEHGTTITVKRDAECDRRFGQILLRTPPGDPMAVLPIRLAYHPNFEQEPSSEKIVPCYRVLRR